MDAPTLLYKINQKSILLRHSIRQGLILMFFSPFSFSELVLIALKSFFVCLNILSFVHSFIADTQIYMSMRMGPFRVWIQLLQMLVQTLLQGTYNSYTMQLIVSRQVILLL